MITASPSIRALIPRVSDIAHLHCGACSTSRRRSGSSAAAVDTVGLKQTGGKYRQYGPQGRGKVKDARFGREKRGAMGDKMRPEIRKKKKKRK